MPRTDWTNMIAIDADFLAKVYAAVEGIPAGRVTTYGKIAELAGYPNASREVGIAMGRAPTGRGLPCHRVVNKNGTLAPSYAFGSQENQRRLLMAEGITFLPDGLIHVEKHMWPDDPQGMQTSFLD